MQDPTQYGVLGPTRTTTITVCMPAFISESGHKLATGAGANRGQGLSTGQHIDAEGLDIQAVVKEIKAQQTTDEEEYFQPPEGAVRFAVSSEQITESLRGKDLPQSIIEDIDVPDQVFRQDEWQTMFDATKPKFVPPSRQTDDNPFPSPEETTGVALRKLSNGIALNYKYSQSERSMGSLRITFPSGQISDPPGKYGLTAMVVNCIREIPVFGNWPRPAFEMFCAQRMIQITALESDHECMFIDMSFWTEENNFYDVAGLLNLFLTKFELPQAVFERARVIIESNLRMTSSSLEDQSDQKVMNMMFGRDRRMLEITQEDLANITLEDVIEHTRKMFQPGNIELSVVGDIDLKTVEEGALKYLGIIPVPEKEEGLKLDLRPLTLQSGSAKRLEIWHQQDLDERALARVCGSSFSAWGPYDLQEPMKTLENKIVPPSPLQPSADPMQVVINNTVRHQHPFFYPCNAILVVTNFKQSVVYISAGLIEFVL
eukprot:TRINITY_DN4163_c0_g1_i6.p1 TRINITY_DN4163_c0_g1~~TRINITY_DN4163_c0_g1_i6.p1  ORF type:complete len:487 (+),score=64.20 TRINITY_DN4163_c0_g1_i6:136-1596(+)